MPNIEPDAIARYPAIYPMLQRQIRAGHHPIVLFTDIDRTFVIQSGSAHDQERHRRNTALLTTYLREQYIPTIAVTGRDISSMQNDHERGELPLFNVALVSLGAECHVLDKGSYIPDDTYIHTLIPYHDWRQHAYPVCLEFQNQVARLIADGMLPGDTELSFQPRDRQAPATVGTPQPYKISLNYFGPLSVTIMLEDVMQRVIAESGQRFLYAVFSFDGEVDGRRRHNVDVLPIGKDVAAQYLVREIRRAEPETRFLYAGDSRNDEEAMRRVGDGAIVVGGYRTDIDMHALKGERLSPNLFRQPHDDRLIYVENDATRRGPASVLEGIRTLRKAWDAGVR